MEILTCVRCGYQRPTEQDGSQFFQNLEEYPDELVCGPCALELDNKNYYENEVPKNEY